MRIVNYKTYWSNPKSPVKRQAVLAEFILDIVYLMNSTGIIPPIEVLNSVIEGGGNSGGMGPGTSWKPFKITGDEYTELVQALLEIDLTRIREHHPYVYFDRIIVDEELNQHSDYLAWLKEAHNKSTF